MMLKNKLILIDGNNVAFRAFFALPLLNTDKGIYTNAIYGFATMLMKILETEKPTHVLVAFDAGKKTFRHETYTEYKGGRQKTPPELSEQFPLILELLTKFGIKHYQVENYEADDIIGTLAAKAGQATWDVKVVTGDKDFLQLANDQVEIALIRKGISDVENYKPSDVQERYGIDPGRIIDLKGLMGDSSDNIPGVPGVGEKTAIKLLKQFGTIEGVYESIDDVSGKKLKEKLIDHHEQALMSKKLATIDREAPVTLSLEECQYTFEVTSELIHLFKELEFHSLLDRIGAEETIDQNAQDEAFEFETLSEITEDHLESPSSLIVEVTDSNYHYGDIHGIGLSNKTGSYFIPIKTALSSEVFRSWLEDEKTEKVVFDGKEDTVALSWREVHLKGIMFDIQLASYLIDPSETNDDLAAISNRHNLSYVYSDDAFYGKGAKHRIPGDEELGEHLARKARACLELLPLLQKKLDINQQTSLFNELELPLSLVLAEMERMGVKTSQDTLEQMGEELSRKLTEIEHDIYELAGTTFNLNSPKQLGEILFEKLQLPVIKKTKTGYSTSADVLEKLAPQHEMIPKLLDYRQLGKLKSTYIEGLLKVIHPKTGRIHTRYNQTLTQTGRLSSIDPNLQNIPIRLEEGRKIRKAFLPSKEDWVIFSADYSQIELRVLAHIAQDEQLIKAFEKGMDIHTKTAMDVFGVKEEDVTSLMRRHAKAVNFGIVYGISDYGLSQSLGITRKEAGQFIEAYLDSFPGVKKYMEDVVKKAKEDGFVTTLLQRRRYLPDIRSRNFNRRSFAERTAMNTPIQGTAADIIKQAMVQMSERLAEEQLTTNMLLQVHDELIFEAPEDEIDKLKRIVPDVMENAVKLDVPLKVEYAYGPTWYDAK